MTLNSSIIGSIQAAPITVPGIGNNDNAQMAFLETSPYQAEVSPFDYYNWLKAFLIFQDIDLESVFCFEHNNVSNWVPLKNLIVRLKELKSSEQERIKDVMMKIQSKKIDIKPNLIFLMKQYCC
jgi:hypothetical protein